MTSTIIDHGTSVLIGVGSSGLLAFIPVSFTISSTTGKIKVDDEFLATETDISDSYPATLTSITTPFPAAGGVATFDSLSVGILSSKIKKDGVFLALKTTSLTATYKISVQPVGGGGPDPTWTVGTTFDISSTIGTTQTKLKSA